MDRLNQFFDHVKERLSSPLFYSFIISWIFCNWEVSVALIWYDPPSTSNGHLSLIDFIASKTNNARSIVYPFLLAVAYTVLSPMISNLISALQAWNSKWGESWNLRILKGGKVSIDKYMEFKKQYEARTKTLEEVIANETATVSELETVKTALQQTQSQLNRTTRELSEIRSVVDNYNNPAYINGKWIRTTINAMNNVVKQNIEFRNGLVYEYDGQRQIERYSVHNYSYDIRGSKLIFTLFHFGGESKITGKFFSFNDLRFHHNQFTGTEYQNGQSLEVSYERSQELPKQVVNDSVEESTEAKDVVK